MGIEAIIYRPKTKMKEATTIHRGLKVSILPRIDDPCVLRGIKRKKAIVGFYCDLPDGSKLAFDCEPQELAVLAVQIEAERRGKQYVPGLGLVNVLMSFDVKNNKVVRKGKKICLR